MIVDKAHSFMIKVLEDARGDVFWAMEAEVLD